MENTTQNQITIADLDTVRTVIDLASSRGAFRAGELQQVGELYNKLTNFLQAAAATLPQSDESAQSADTSTQGE
jgi:hypothetical protein